MQISLFRNEYCNFTHNYQTAVIKSFITLHSWYNDEHEFSFVQKSCFAIYFHRIVIRSKIKSAAAQKKAEGISSHFFFQKIIHRQTAANIKNCFRKNKNCSWWEYITRCSHEYSEWMMACLMTSIAVSQHLSVSANVLFMMRSSLLSVITILEGSDECKT